MSRTSYFDHETAKWNKWVVLLRQSIQKKKADWHKINSLDVFKKYPRLHTTI